MNEIIDNIGPEKLTSWLESYAEKLESESELINKTNKQ